VREGLGMVLASEPDIDVVGTAADPATLIEMCRSERPDAVVLELDADVWDAPRLAAALRRQQRSLRIVGTYEKLSTELARRAVKAGIRVAAAHPAGSDGIVAALRAHDSVPLVSHLPSRLTTPAPTTMLTPRELEVLTLIADGHTAAEVARRLGISPKTVENRKQSIFSKLDVQNQAHAVAVALRSGVLPPRLSASGG
jgi:DNA-binding NarL/FixJ family response regulator